MNRRPPRSPLFPYTTLFRSTHLRGQFAPERGDRTGGRGKLPAAYCEASGHPFAKGIRTAAIETRCRRELHLAVGTHPMLFEGVKWSLAIAAHPVRAHRRRCPAAGADIAFAARQLLQL